MNEINQDIIERGLALGLSMKTMKRMLNPKSFEDSGVLPTMKERATESPTHHMILNHGKYYFKLIQNGKCISHPLSKDVEEAKRMRDNYLSEYDYR
jgi:hypothetical protein